MALWGTLVQKLQMRVPDSKYKSEQVSLDVLETLSVFATCEESLDLSSS